MEEVNSKVFLSQLNSGERCLVVKVLGYGGFKNRVMELGFVKGRMITVIKNAPLQDPIEYELMNSHVSLRRSEADLIEVLPLDKNVFCNDQMQQQEEALLSSDTDDCLIQAVDKKRRHITVALVGNPNSGKTTFYNALTGRREKVGNYAGVTVGMKNATLKYKEYTITIVDLPGTYSITDFSPEERYVRDFIANYHPDIILNVVDASNLERNLFLSTQLIDMNFTMIMALNMYDELEGLGAQLDYQSLAKMLGFPIVPTTASKGEGLDEILENIVTVFEDKNPYIKHIHINYGSMIEKAIDEIKKEVLKDVDVINKLTPRYLALKCLENEQSILRLFKQEENFKAIEELSQKNRQVIEKEYKEDISSVVANAKYGFIHGAIKETYTPSPSNRRQWSYSLDTVLTNRWIGFPVLVLFLWIMFQATFTLGAYPQDWISAGVEWLSLKTATIFPQGVLHDLLVDGILAGVGGVLIYLPNIVILFLFISLMEDTGYMARAAFIMDKLMHKIGLHGKSFIPMLTGFGCSVPAVMATRMLENKKDRILTMLVIPFMSCSARLPVYLLFISAFFSAHQGLMLLLIYFIGIFVAAVVSFVLSKTIFKGSSDQFVMELPPYRMPTAKNILVHMWDKTAQYVKKMGTLILAASIVIWFLGYFPRESEKVQMADNQIAKIEQNETLSPQEQESLLEKAYLQKQAFQKEASFVGMLGHAIEPAVKPLGLDWKMGVSILTGFAAKEVVVASISVLYQVNENETSSLATVLKNSKDKENRPVFTPLVAFVFILFVLLYFPCLPTILAIRREVGWKWALFTMFYTTALAWIVCFAVYQIGSLI